MSTMTYSDSTYSDLSTLEFDCDDGYMVSGPLEKQCKYGEWIPDDLVECRPLT